MAYKPSERRSSSSELIELDIRPIMNLMVCLIPLLLAGAQFVKNTQLQVNLPPGRASSSSEQSVPPEEKKEKKLNLSLILSITKDGFRIQANHFEDYKKVLIPLHEGRHYDYLSLREKLKELKKLVDASGKNFVDRDRIILTAEKNIPYEVYIKAQDAASGEVVDGEIKDIFAIVQIGQVV